MTTANTTEASGAAMAKTLKEMQAAEAKNKAKKIAITVGLSAAVVAAIYFGAKYLTQGLEEGAEIPSDTSV